MGLYIQLKITSLGKGLGSSIAIHSLTYLPWSSKVNLIKNCVIRFKICLNYPVSEVFYGHKEIIW